MSAWVKCEICGGMKEVPAFEGDGVYSEHYCQSETEYTDEQEEVE